jgi:multidrug efflux pump subunit AcrA (membrane-fusion protein)
MITRGSIVKWHKAEGQRVAFGEALCDLKVEEIQISQLLPFDVPRQIELLINAQEAARHLLDEDVAFADPGPQPDCQLAVFGMRVISSDHGVLRKIHAKEGDQREIGDLLAMFSTEENQPIHVPNQVPTGASVFRAVVNLI